MSLTDFFHNRPNSRQTRSGFIAGHSSKNKKLRDRDESSPGRAFKDDMIGPLGIVFSVLLVAGAVAILDYGVLPPVYREKERPQFNVYSRVSFDYNDPDELKILRTNAEARAPRVYTEDGEWVDKLLRDLNELIGIVDVANSARDARDRAARFPHDADLVEELFKYNDNLGGRREFLSSVLLGKIRFSLRTIAANGVLKDEDLEFERNKPGYPREIVRVTGIQNGPDKTQKSESRLRVRVEKLRNIVSAVDEFRRASWRESMPSDLERLIFQHLYPRFMNNLKMDAVQSEIELQKARSLVDTGAVRVKEHDVILNKDQPIRRSDLERLHEEYRAYKASLTPEARVGHIAGLATMVTALFIMFLCVATRIQEGIFLRRRALVMLGLLLLAALCAVKALVLAGFSIALAPFVFVGIVASLAFGQSIALLTLFALCILTEFAEVRWLAFPLDAGVPALNLALMAGGIAAALPAERLRDRWDILSFAALGGIVQGFLAVGLSQLGDGWTGVPTLTDALLALANGPGCGLLVLGSLPLIESLFGILTNIRLFELADMNQPALKRIQMEAPGTFAHTLQVRFLAEPASDAIGANTRLVSAGVLYHDLGKTLKPEYFVENQMDAETLHRRLRPSVSALLITAHVKDGVELAREFGLPQKVIDFIQEHHGTTLVSYFFNSAKKSAQAEAHVSGSVDAVQEAFFRYPGPKPQSRETGIVMLADTVEAASRTLDNPSAARLSVFVHELIMNKMLDGQLDECGLTFADLALIEDTFMRVLVTRFHSRIRYPNQEAELDAALNKTTVVEAMPPRQSDTPAATTPVTGASSRREVLTETRFLGRRQK